MDEDSDADGTSTTHLSRDDHLSRDVLSTALEEFGLEVISGLGIRHSFEFMNGDALVEGLPDLGPLTMQTGDRP